jgi:Lon-like ATP-dependent protease
MRKMDDGIKWSNTNPPPKLSKKSYSSFNLTKNDLFEGFCLFLLLLLSKRNRINLFLFLILLEHMISLGNVENLIEPPFCKTDPMIQAIVSEISTGFKEIAGFNPAFRDQIFPYSTIAKVFNEPSKLADFTASISVGGEPFELQQILDTTSVEKRLQLSLEVLKKELGHVRLQEQISKDADSQITKRQRESFLLNELEKIKKELGLDSDMKQKWMAIFKERADGLSMTESAQKVYHEVSSKDSWVILLYKEE